MRILILADDCNPDWPSLPVVGYKFARAIANLSNAVVVTQVRNQPNIEREGMGRAKVVYLDTEKIAAPLYKLATALRGGTTTGWTLQMAMNYPSYLAFEWFAWRRFRQDLQSGQFDLVHRLTPMSPTLPSPMAQWSPVPFLLGPLNGNLPWPQQFQTELSREREWLSYLRDAYKLLPYYHSTYMYSAGILAAFEHTMADLPSSVKAKTINFPEVGIDQELFNLPQRTRPQLVTAKGSHSVLRLAKAEPASDPATGQAREQMTILFVGRLVPYKLPEVVVRAFAKSEILRQHKLLVVGEGPERSRLETMISEQALESCVFLTGQKTQAEVSTLMRQADILAFPSIRELGAGVVVEAMACGMACVVVDYGGPAMLIESERGIKIPLGNLDSLVNAFREALEQLVSNRDRLVSLGEAAHRHAMAYYSWDAKAQKMIEVYEWVAGHRQAKPNFFGIEPASEQLQSTYPAKEGEAGRD